MRQISPSCRFSVTDGVSVAGFAPPSGWGITQPALSNALAEAARDDARPVVHLRALRRHPADGWHRTWRRVRRTGEDRRSGPGRQTFDPLQAELSVTIAPNSYEFVLGMPAIVARFS